jgi:hypothetical protein
VGLGGSGPAAGRERVRAGWRRPGRVGAPTRLLTARGGPAIRRLWPGRGRWRGKWRVWPWPRSWDRAGKSSMRGRIENMSSRSERLSAAMSGARVTGRPTASSASRRWTRVSWVMRRSQNPAVWSSAQVHTWVSGPAWPTASTSRRAPASSHVDRSSAASGTRRSSARSWGTGLVARRSTMTAAQRWPNPTCSVSCASVQAGQVGTGWAGSASCTAAANLAVSAWSSVS